MTSAPAQTQQGKRHWMHLIATALLLGALLCAYPLFQTAAVQRELKADYAELHSVRYELVNAQVWAEKLSAVLDRKIDQFEFTEQNQAQVKSKVEAVLDRLILEVDRAIRKHNTGGDSLLEITGNLFKQMATDVLIDIQSLRRNVPEFAASIMEELKDPTSREGIKQALKEHLQQAAEENFTQMDMAPYRELLQRYRCINRAACTPLLQARIAEQTQQLFLYTGWTLGLSLALFLLLTWRGLPLRSWGLWLLVSTGLLLLVLGVALPMIEIEAKIEELRLFILGEPLVFTDQLLYFRSKSIVDVVHLLVATGKAKMILVGLLLTLFSVLFPALKLLATYVHFYDFRGWGGHGVVRFFTFRSGKWSMADVMVVAMFMAYLGFDGVIANQLKHLGGASNHLNVLTTNGTHLEVGFFLFLGFVLTGLGVSTLVERSDLLHKPRNGS